MKKMNCFFEAMVCRSMTYFSMLLSEILAISLTFLMGVHKGVVGLEVGGRIKQDGSNEDLFHDGNQVDFVVGGKR
jgi:hypothetical protein